MEIVSLQNVMDALRTMSSYGPLSVLLAVITLLWRVVLSGTEIEKAHRTQALHATHNNACTDERSDGYQWLISMIYGRSFQVEMGNIVLRQSQCIQRKRRETLAWRSRNNG